ncbi:MAG: transcriptional regulator [Chitinophagales bacterium]|jgi:DNA-binding HxlR family transcriptional regulator|nr:transcriptional regulator [Chitinophagales bacterium]
MKEHLDRVDKAFENSIRLSIMALLMVNATVDFNSLNKLLGTTDGNLSSNLSYLISLKYVAVKKRFINKKPNTSYSALEAGRKAFKSHIEAMEKIILHSKKITLNL